MNPGAIITRSEPTRESGAPRVQASVSIIVPALDESATIRPFLEHLRARAPGAEVIVVYAQSAGQEKEMATDLCDRVLTSARGRAVQMNAGAAVARGDVLWFVHADCEVPSDCLEKIVAALDDPQTVGGCFRIRFQRRQLIYRVSDSGGNLAVELFGRCYGDHGIFCRRAEYVAIGGYPDVPLLEDAEFYRRMRSRGLTIQLASEIVPSPRRFEKIGPYRLTASYMLISTLYLLRMPIWLLARIYEWLCRSSDEPRRLSA